MGYLDDIQIWSFRGQPAARLLSSNAGWEEWFEEDSVLSIEPILDTSDRYVDVGGTTISALQLTLAFVDEAARATFMSMRGTSGTLSRPGRSRTALLRRAQPLAAGHNGYVLLAVSFEAV